LTQETKKANFQKKKENVSNMGGRQPDLEYEEEKERETERVKSSTKETLRFHRGFE
jgi:hypothetical protein